MTEQQKIDEKYMQRALQLATCGRGYTSPNPMVGAVIVYQDRIIGEGYHRCCGQGHAEVNAVASVRDKSLLSESTIYVTLEPCSHYGKTPPCAKLLIDNHLKRCVVGVEDPFPEVSGRGINMLREAGIEVTVGVLREACYHLNRAFMTVQQKHRPYVILKWAQSLDGFLDKNRTSAEEPPIVLSDEPNRVRVHRLRAVCDAILVGCHTALLDRPSLTARYWSCRQQPLRICIDPHACVSTDNPILNDAAETWHITSALTPQEICAELQKRKIQTLIVEGGRDTLQRFIDYRCFDELQIETASILLHEGVTAPTLPQAVLVDNHVCGKSIVNIFRAPMAI